MAKGKKTGGRQPGSTNKNTAEIKALAQKHGPELVASLVKMALDEAIPHAARVAASKEVLDRGYGKSPQPQTGEGGEGPVSQVIQIVTGVPR